MRKGSTSIDKIPYEVLCQLEKGTLETASLVEWLGMDQWKLLEVVLAELDLSTHFDSFKSLCDELPSQTANSVAACIGNGFVQLTKLKSFDDIFQTLATHRSDCVRGWACYMVKYKTDVAFEQKLSLIKPLAADAHFGVREVAWMAMRSDFARNLTSSIAALAQWTLHENEYIRRFACEISRPRGVWCNHIETLKKQPQMGLLILEPLKADPSRYVQNSVANWLNDAAKTAPDFVRTITLKWQLESPSPHTTYIVKRATRNLS